MNLKGVMERIRSYPGEIVLDAYGFEGNTGFLVLSFQRNGNIEGELTIKGSREELQELALFLKNNIHKIFEHQRNAAWRALEDILT